MVQTCRRTRLRISSEPSRRNAQNGLGVPKDLEVAVKWYKRAAEQEMPQRKAIWVSCITMGWGVQRTIILKVKWFSLDAQKKCSASEI